MTEQKKNLHRAKQGLTDVFAFPYTPYIVLYAVLLIFHCKMTNTFGDDANYCTLLQTTSLWAQTVKHYYTWSARNIIEAVLCLVGAMPIAFWRMSNPFVISFCAYALVKLIGGEKQRAIAWASVSLVFLYSWFDMYSAGWVTTTLVYVWPFAAGLAAMLISAKAFRGEKIKPLFALVSILLIIYAGNMEQMNLLLCIILLAVLTSYALRKKAPHYLIMAQFVCVIANFIYAFTCPGTKARMESEIAARYKNFAMVPFLAKVESGFSISMNNVVYVFNALSILFVLLLFLVVCTKYKSCFYRIFAAFPLVIVLIFGAFGDWLIKLFPIMARFKGAMLGTNFINITNCNSIGSYLPFMLLCVVFVAWFLNIYLAFGHCAKSIVAATALLSGFCSRAALGFSPTAGASGERTAFFFMFSIVFVSIMLFRELYKEQNKALLFAFWLPCGMLTLRQLYSFWEALYK